MKNFDASELLADVTAEVERVREENACVACGTRPAVTPHAIRRQMIQENGPEYRVDGCAVETAGWFEVVHHADEDAYGYAACSVRRFCPSCGETRKLPR